MMRSAIGVAGVVLAVTVSGGQQQTPGDWTWRTDTPATLGSGDAAGPTSWHFVMMPPGWHITTGPGALLYPKTANTARGNFRIEAEVFLFPGTAQQEYGIFLGGANLEASSTAPVWLAFVARRDGRAAILQRTAAGVTPVVDWTTNEAIVPHPGGESGTAKNALSVEAGMREIVFSANGKPVARITRADVPADGVFGLRIGAGLNLHISTFDVTHRLAPPK